MLTRTQSFAGGDPDDFAQEEEQSALSEQKSDKSEDIDQNELNNESMQNISEITEAAFLFLKLSHIKSILLALLIREKNRMARINWSFSKLLLR